MSLPSTVFAADPGGRTCSHILQLACPPLTSAFTVMMAKLATLPPRTTELTRVGARPLPLMYLRAANWYVAVRRILGGKAAVGRNSGARGAQEGLELHGLR